MINVADTVGYTTPAEMVKLLEYLDAHKARLTPEEKRMVFLMLKEIRFLQKQAKDFLYGSRGSPVLR